MNSYIEKLPSSATLGLLSWSANNLPGVIDVALPQQLASAIAPLQPQIGLQVLVQEEEDSRQWMPYWKLYSESR